MNAIMGMTRVALMNIEDSKVVTDALSKTSTAADLLMNIIEEILEMTRIESGNVVIELESIDLYQLKDEIAFSTEIIARKSGRTIKVIEGKPYFRFVFGDKQRIKRVLTNIISNAVKFTPEDGIIEIRLSQNKPCRGVVETVFEVSDNGIGMSEEFCRHAFETFAQADVNKGGTGLGLAICDHLVKMMGGTIDLQSRNGKGASVTFTLPLKPNEEKHKRVRAQTEENTDVNLYGKRALLADDDDISREISTMLLEEFGMAVDTAENGLEAVQKFTASKVGQYDVIVLDIMMPVMGGYEAAEAIRKSPRADAGTVPVIALSANAFEQDAIISKSHGMNSHVTKPVSPEDLKFAIVSELSQSVSSRG